jgi:peptide/nickel transport system ATP-binding protein
MGVMQLIQKPGEIVGGQVFFEGRDLLEYKRNSAQMREIRGNQIAMIFQEPMSSLNPVLKIGTQLMEPSRRHCNATKGEAWARAVELLELVGIPGPEERMDAYPHQFSGGMCQRVMIAAALCCNPKVLIADEPTTALDVTTQAQMLDLMQELVERFEASLVIVTHNLGVVARYAQRIYVMYAGRVVEAGTTKQIFGSPRHPYTVGLLKSIPRLDEKQGARLVPIEGMPPSLIGMSKTCAFLPRCPYKIKRCSEEPWPDLEEVGDKHFARCYVNIEEKTCEPALA